MSIYYRFLQCVLMRMRPAILAASLKKILGVKRIVTHTPHGDFKVDPVSLIGVALTRDGVLESAMTATLGRLLQKGSVFVDLGANEGYFTVIGGRLCGNEGKVLAIEPQQRLQQVILDNLELNQIQNVSLLNVAISDVSTMATLHLASTTNTGGSGLHRHSKYKLPTQTIRTLTLEQALDANGFAKVDLMKVDIEGHEYEALLGSRKLFEERRVKALAIELHPVILAELDKNPDDIIAMLRRYGYSKDSSFENDVWIAPS